MAELHEPHPREADRLIYAGLLGLAAAGVIQLCDRSDLNVPQLVGVYSFSAAIPLLAVGLITDYARRAGTHVPVWRDGLGAVGVIVAVVGFGALLFHFGIGVGLVFVVGCLLGFVLVRQW